LSGLVLSPDEFKAHFKRHREELAIKQSNKVFVVSSQKGGGCPYWGPDGCQIYLQRPIDCRVFPYVTARIIENRSNVKIVFHSRSDCPLKDQLYLKMPESDIRNLLMELGKSVYGSTKTIVVQHERGIISRFRNRIEAAISRRLYKSGQIHNSCHPKR
jgi:Fe-S-cluster containining protein